jgi:hypothetical protein
MKRLKLHFYCCYSILIFLFLTSYLTYESDGQTLRISDDINFRILEDGNALLEFKSYPEKDFFFLDKEQNVTERENQELKPIPGGYKATGVIVLKDRKTGKVLSPKVKLFSYENIYQLTENKSISVHSDMTYLCSHTNSSGNLGGTFKLAHFDENRHWKDLSKGVICDITSKTGAKKSYNIFTENFKRSFDNLRFDLVRPGFTVSIQPGKNSQMAVEDGRQTNNNDLSFLCCRISSKVPGVKFVSRDGDKDSFEYLLSVVKNDVKSSGSESDSSVEAPLSLIVSVNTDRRSILIKDISSGEETTLVVNDLTKIFLNKSTSPFFLLQPGMKVSVIVGDDPTVAKIINATSQQ